MEFILSGNKIESGKLTAINDEPFISIDSKNEGKINDNNFSDIKNILLNKAKKNLNHFSKSN